MSVSGSKTTWTVRSMVAWMQADFEKRGIWSARLEADLLVAHALGQELPQPSSVRLMRTANSSLDSMMRMSRSNGSESACPHPG